VLANYYGAIIARLQKNASAFFKKILSFGGFCILPKTGADGRGRVVLFYETGIWAVPAQKRCRIVNEETERSGGRARLRLPNKIRCKISI